jgi:NAD(P)-dependent dehydrogenase (short-subunit alcohol dehydrogenase family)
MNRVCVVMGVGPGNGEAFVRRFCKGSILAVSHRM